VPLDTTVVQQHLVQVVSKQPSVEMHSAVTKEPDLEEKVNFIKDVSSSYQ